MSSDELADATFHTIWEYDSAQLPEWVGGIDPELAADWLGPQNAGGLRWLLVPFPPETEVHEHRQLQGIDENGFHTTTTVDFDCLIEGELTLILDDDRVQLRKGDCVVQRATRHAWKNETATTAVLVAILHRVAGNDRPQS